MSTEKKTILEIFNSKWFTPSLAIVTGILSVFSTFQYGKLERQAKQLEIVKSQIDTQLRKKEFENNLKLKIYEEVKDAIVGPADTMKQKAALFILNEMLRFDSSFRENLRTVLYSGSPIAVRLMDIDKNSKDSVEPTTEQTLEPGTKANTTASARLKVDIFYLDDGPKAKDNAESIANYINQKYSGKYFARARLLQREINARSGYRIDANQIRFESKEKQDADNIQTLIKDIGQYKTTPFILRPTTYNTPNYISVFVKE